MSRWPTIAAAVIVVALVAVLPVDPGRAADERVGASRTAPTGGDKQGEDWVGSPYPPGTVVPVVPTMGAKMDLPGSGQKLGRKVFQKWCTPCHAPGPAYAGTVALAEKYKGTSIPGELESRADLNEALIRHAVRNGVYTMPSFRKTEITEDELAAVVAYLAKVQPAR